MNRSGPQLQLSKVPEVTLIFWVVKIFATTLGETAGDTVSMTWGLGYLVGTGIFATALLTLVLLQIRAVGYRPTLYWSTIVASTTAGTTMADFADRSLGIGYAGGSAALLVLVIASLATWRWTIGRVSVDDVTTPRAEIFYWLTITFSQTLGTALGDWVADAGPGFGGAALIFGAALVIVAALYSFTSISHVLLFWLAFILTRPLGATIGDLFDKPHRDGGLDFSRPLASAILAGAIVLVLVIFPQRPGRHVRVGSGGGT